MTRSTADSLRILMINGINNQVEVETRFPSLGLGYLVSSALRWLPDVPLRFQILDHDVPQAVERFQPHLACVSSVSQNFETAKEYTAYFHRQGVPVILGGVHVTSLPHSIPPGVAAACLGEGELTFVDLLKTLAGGGLTPERLRSIPGLAYRDEAGRLHLTPPREQISPLDQLPLPARDLLEIRPHTYMFTSRGCPYRCTFCFSSRYWDSVRFFSAEYVVEEIKRLVRDHGVTMISFYDDLFVAKRSRLEEMIRLLERDELLGKVKFTCSCRANLVDAELARLLSRLGMVSVGMGLESGDEETLQYLKSGAASVADNNKAINVLKDAGIFVNGSFIIGSPHETREQIMNTYRFIQKSRLDLFDVYLLTPLPGTPVWEEALQRGLVSNDLMDWSRLNVNAYRDPDKAIIMSEVLSRQEILNLYRRFRRLRWRRNIGKVWSHPIRRDLPRKVWKHAKERFFARAHASPRWKQADAGGNAATRLGESCVPR